MNEKDKGRLIDIMSVAQAAKKTIEDQENP
jgi:hypothetical protein